ncbi:hypothetical protein QZH41_010936, partial [Actinostola sp. cb2023]
MRKRCKENCKEKKIIDEILSYVGECTKHCPRQIMVEWSLFKHIKSTGSWQQVLDLQSKTMSNISSFSFVLRNKVLEAGTRYVIRMSAWNTEGGAKGLTEHQFTTSIPPYGGFCTASPNEGVALDTFFSIRCYNWTMETEPATYKFGYVDVYTDLKDILYVASDPEASVQLPAGHPDRSMVLELSVTVQDYNGLQTSVNVPTTVQPRKINSSEVTRLILANNSKLDFYIQSGDINAASELVSGFVSILNYEATMN